jgi:hypothetical protein
MTTQADFGTGVWTRNTFGRRFASMRAWPPCLAVVLSVASFACVVPAAGSAAAPSSRAAAQSRVLFDDFKYSGSDPLFQLWQHGWKVRTAQGWPGATAATWSASAISFVRDPVNRRNELLRLTSSTDGTAAGTNEAQICQARKFYEGTYATRVRFEDTPDLGADGDQLVETFYAISPLQAPLDPNYSELDWEYLPNGGWGMTAPTLWVTSWATVQLDPWIADNTYATATGSLDGWHTLVLQVADGSVNYYLDGVLLASHAGKYYPDVPMSINYNLWFVDGGQLPAGPMRRYHEDVDWIYHQADVVLSPQAVLAQVAKLRRAHVAFRDSVPPESPPLDSPCNF